MGALALEGTSVLVHCHEGKSRSVALLLAYFMTVQGWTLHQALTHIRLVQWANFQIGWLAFD